MTREELIEAFGAAGKVLDAKVPTDRETGRPRGFAFVEFEDDDAAAKSISLLNGKTLKGRPLRVNEAENRPPRQRGANFQSGIVPRNRGHMDGPGPGFDAVVSVGNATIIPGRSRPRLTGMEKPAAQ